MSADDTRSHDDPAGLGARVAEALAQPGLVIVTGPAGSGRSHLLHRLAGAFRGPVYAGGGLSMLRGNSALALARAVKAKLPTHDTPLCAEAVRSRVRGGLLVIDDLQWCDPVTLAVLPKLAEHCRIAAALRTPHRLPEAITEPLFAAATTVEIPPIPDAAAAALVRDHAPGLADAAVTALVKRAGGNPLALASLARHAQARGGKSIKDPAQATPDAVHVLAEAIADLPRAARTALAALGLLGRPAPAGLLGEGVSELAEAGLVTVDDNQSVAPVSPYSAEIAAGILDPDGRAELHRGLAELVDDVEAARHLAAAGDNPAAYQRALRAAGGDNQARRAEALLFACALSDSPADEATRLEAAAAALAVGRPRSALTVLEQLSSVEATVARAQAHLHAGHTNKAAEVAATLPDSSKLDDGLAEAVDRVRLLTALAGASADTVAAAVRARHGDRPSAPGLAAAVAAHDARRREPGWQQGLAAAAVAAGRDGDALTARWSAWLLVEYLIADGNLDQAAAAAERAAAACTADHAYSWQTRFLAAQVWCRVLGGGHLEEAASRAVTLLDHALPSVARGYATASASLAEADTGALRNARHRLRNAGPVPPSVATVLRWVAGEAAWLDNQPAQARAAAGDDASLVSGMGRITANWAAFDAGEPSEAGDIDSVPDPARQTLSAWQAAAVDASAAGAFDTAAEAWREVVVREQVRCLLAHGLYAPDAAGAVPPLEAAEAIADEAGLTILAGRARQALRRHRVRRDRRGKRAGDALTSREQQVLTMVAAGEPTRRIAVALGITRETVETHIRAGMRKLGAKTRTEAAVRAAELLTQDGQ
ncbi:helix-turn-helix transcriptional regulator [Stackebrandtia nassauensis]|uniref:Transcriptional regulator, LuxR family n=1 Tax=Stackebrandtia nassauensis (strain DSM 44728 / CIP 108903 / NRRL B-16338 / NBRC 102104 / LLR-40K-21) TaxID=446470 RepID=D3PXQ3_STANL|nr:LuxR family transcriptional regulator [Stackebrandtia nassauensis]ADD43383.1 transcriptional regulator, LuxR family [Stackebrandtia nassauensis DSM 44728]